MVVVNAYILRVILIMVAKTLRFKNLTEEIKWVTIAIFWMYMFNYGFVYIFGPWDSRESEIPIIQSFYGGIYTDQNAFWFNDIGVSIATTMISNMYYPALEFFGYWSLRYLFRCIDQRNPLISNPYSTNCKTIQQFESTY